ncbi:MAG TPA: type VI secretion system baseplate subunit TssE [Pirellulaceae bacterium]|nr:type VI secretion system baseplate subunit TssE [Pirellulaceae bacterium]
MSSPRPTELLVTSLLDRLIDTAPQESQEAPRQRHQIVREIKQAVRRDLENLLNTRWQGIEVPEHFQELPSSLMNYGIPDFTGNNLRGAEDPDIVFEAIRQAIERFEPRLRNIVVKPVAAQHEGDRTLRFRIEATLWVEPITDPVTFDSRLEPATGVFQVEGVGR